MNAELYPAEVAQAIKELISIIEAKKEIEKKEPEARKTILEYLEQINNRQFPANGYVFQLQERPSRDSPTPLEVIELLGQKDALKYLKVTSDLRGDLPPNMQDKMFPITEVKKVLNVISSSEADRRKKYGRG